MSRDFKHPHIDPATKAEWIAQLRSNNYAQGTNCLRSIDNHYCCLGVLCEVISLPWHLEPETEDNPWQSTEYIVFDVAADDRGHSDFIPPIAAHRVGLHLTTSKHLAEMNDNGATFAEIADWIETNL